MVGLPTDDERVAFYLGTALQAAAKGSPFDIRSRRDLHVLNDLQEDPRGDYVKRGYSQSRYDRPLAALLQKCGYADRAFCYAGDDRVRPDSGPILVKNRYMTQEPVLLRCLDGARHWDGAWARDGLAFHEKADSVFWRGGLSGWEYRPTSRAQLVRGWFGKRADVHVGVTALDQEYALPGVRERWKHTVLGTVDREVFLQHKYVISAEGNDKDSGLAWKLASNSLVLMVAPVVESWIMEPWLKPYVHYVPLQPDYADLGTQLEWCRGHQRECQQMVHAASEYMAQFSDLAHEEALERQVVHEYFARVRALTGESVLQHRRACSTPTI